MKSKTTLLIFIALLLSMSLVSAGFSVGNASHKLSSDYYGAESNIEGWFNISFSNEPGNSFIKDTWGNQIKLLDLLESDFSLNEEDDYTCSLEGCIPDYSTSAPATQKILSLTAGNEKILGFKFSDDITAIDSVEFTVESNAGASCTNQLKIDIGNDGTIDKGNNQASSEICGGLKNYGCYDSSKTSKGYSIGYFPAKHCQKINLSASPGFKLGAWIEKGSDTREFKIGLYTLGGSRIQNGNCILPTAPVSGGEVSCNIDYLLTQPKEHYVCVYSDSGTGSAKVKGYKDSENGCGFYGTGIQTEDAAFKIFAIGKKYNSVGTLEITNSISTGSTLGQLFESYIYKKYKSLDCSGGCTVPIKFIPSTNQQVTLKNLQIKYGTTLGSVTENNFYTVDEEVPSKISSDFIQISLNNASFKTPTEFGNNTFILQLGNNEIFSQDVSIEKVAEIKTIHPNQTSSALPTTFTVDVEKGEANITLYSWDFGDNSTETTTTNKITHTYNAIDVYDLEITVTDKKGFTSSKTFEINVGSSEEIVNVILNKMQKNLAKVKSEITTYSEFSQNSLNKALGMENLEGEIARLNNEVENIAVEEEDFNSILSDLLQLNIPDSIYPSIEADSIPYTPGPEDIDLDILISAGGEDDGSRENYEYKDAIIDWGYEYLDAQIDFKEISGSYGKEGIPLVNIFTININEKKALDSNPFFIIEKLENLEFAEEYLAQEEANHYYIELKQSQQTITFSTTENVDFLDLEMFIAPKISRLVFQDKPTPPEPDVPYNWFLLVMILVLVLLIAIGIYTWLQVWYKKKYENYLFQNKNNLYNLINYVHNSKSKGWDDREIISKLRKSGWKSEQISYVMKKYAGKETGIAEIPINKILNKFKRKPLHQGRKMPGKYEFKRYKKL